MAMEDFINSLDNLDKLPENQETVCLNCGTRHPLLPKEIEDQIVPQIINHLGKVMALASMENPVVTAGQMHSTTFIPRVLVGFMEEYFLGLVEHVYSPEFSRQTKAQAKVLLEGLVQKMEV